jgi:16S rRNA (cytidine1402-2'-O)-methyltransferase
MECVAPMRIEAVRKFRTVAIQSLPKKHFSRLDRSESADRNVLFLGRKVNIYEPIEGCESCVMGTLSVVATPIGNLGDITLRAIETLKDADAIACEDTRVTAKLLARFDIQKPLLIYHAQSGRLAATRILTLLAEGKRVALVTDAGTPGISDPGSMLVAEVKERLGNDVRVETIPGPSALTAALSIAGIPMHEFIFIGFLPHKKGRQTAFKDIAANERTVVFYESIRNA